MTTSTKHTHSIGAPQIAGPLAVFPVFGPEPQADYLAFSQAHKLGAFVTELESGADVRQLVVGNPTGKDLLIYEGEEVLGAQQNRTFDSPILVRSNTEIEAPVSCVEAGRWDSRRAREHFEPAPQVADPQLRAAKRRAAAASFERGGAAKADQSEVWNEVSARLSDHMVESASCSMHDLYQEKRSDLARFTGVVDHQPGQIGAVTLISGRPVALDLVSRPEVFAALLPRLAQGYALDALGASVAELDSIDAGAFLHKILRAKRNELPTEGAGRGCQIAIDGITGAGIELDGELIALSAFPAEQR